MEVRQGLENNKANQQGLQSETATLIQPIDRSHMSK